MSAVYNQPRGLPLLHTATSVLKNSQVVQVVQAGRGSHEVGVSAARGQLTLVSQLVDVTVLRESDKDKYLRLKNLNQIEWSNNKI
jgi:hypothetical protein